MKRSLSTLSTLCAVLLVLVFAQAINGGLSLHFFEKQQLAMVLSGYDDVGVNIAEKIQRALRLGKNLENFPQVDDLLRERALVARDLDNVSIHRAGGETLAFLYATPVPSPEMVAANTARMTKSRHLRVEDSHFLFFPLASGVGEVSILCLTFSNERLLVKRLSIMTKSLKVLALCTVVAALLLIAGFNFFPVQAVFLGKQSFFWFLLVVVGSAQLVCSGYNMYLFHNDHLELIRSKSQTVARLLQQDVEAMLQKGHQLNSLLKIDRQLENTLDRVPELKWLAIEDSKGEVLYRGGQRTKIDGEGSVEYLELSGRQGPVGRLAIGLNVEVVKKAGRKIACDALIIVALSLLIIMELVLFLSATILKGSVMSAKDGQSSVDLDALARTAIFLFIFAVSLCYFSIPQHMANLYRPLFGLSQEMFLGLPLALEMLGGGLVLIPVGVWIDIKGWRQPFIVGVFLAMLGMAASGLTRLPLVFVVARFLTGMGYGMAWMAAQGHVLKRTELPNRAKTISSEVAGILSGGICGNGMGAIIAERLGYRHVFIIGAVIMACGLVFVILFMRSTFHPPKAPEVHRRLSLWRVLTDPQALLIFCCNFIPYAIGMVVLL